MVSTLASGTRGIGIDPRLLSAREFSVSEHTSLRVIGRYDMKTVCHPLDRDVNWRPPVQGKSHPVKVKEPYSNSKMATCRPSSCNLECTVYTVFVLLGG